MTVYRLDIIGLRVDSGMFCDVSLRAARIAYVQLRQLLVIVVDDCLVDNGQYGTRSLGYVRIGLQLDNSLVLPQKW